MLVHRNRWTLGQLASALTAQQIEVVAQVEDGAEGLGIIVAEQPDLVLVEDLLPSMSGFDVLRALRQVARRTVVAAQVSTESARREMLEAGAAAVFHRRIGASEIASRLAGILSSVPEPRPRSIVEVHPPAA